MDDSGEQLVSVNYDRRLSDCLITAPYELKETSGISSSSLAIQRCFRKNSLRQLEVRRWWPVLHVSVF